MSDGEGGVVDAVADDEQGTESAIELMMGEERTRPAADMESGHGTYPTTAPSASVMVCLYTQTRTDHLTQINQNLTQVRRRTRDDRRLGLATACDAQKAVVIVLHSDEQILTKRNSQAVHFPLSSQTIHFSSLL